LEAIQKDSGSPGSRPTAIARNMVLHAMLLAIQSAIDIATEVIVLKGYKRPASYRETFGILEANGILTRDLARPLSNLAGFRKCPGPCVLGP